MGTRADFYLGEGADARWLGSIAMDGYPDGAGNPRVYGLDDPMLSSEGAYLERVERMLRELDHATVPTQGWPWPWEDSCTTDFAYTWIEGQGVCVSRFGRQLVTLQEYLAYDEEQEEQYDDWPKVAVWPQFTRCADPFHERSGLIVLGVRD